jgi:GTP-binding protein
MIIRSAVFLKSGLKAGDFPLLPHPEIAFAGRSNVGKSSLINTLLGRKHLVRTSRTPGQTQTLNFFLINEDLVFVDLPGYGYSQASKAIIRTYQQAMMEYLQFRPSLILLVLLLDIRRTPSEEDQFFFQLAKKLGMGPLVVLTKADKINRGKWGEAAKEISRPMDWGGQEALFFSTRSQLGQQELWQALSKRIESGQRRDPQDQP